MNALKEKFQALTEREQKLVLLSGVMIIIALFYFIIWSPLTTSLEQAKTRGNAQQKLLGWVQENANRAQQLRRSNSTQGGLQGSLAQAVSRSTQQFSIPVSRMQPLNDELQVWVDEAPFDAVLAWLEAMEEMGVVIRQLDITEANAPGLIKIRRLQLGKS